VAAAPLRTPRVDAETWLLPAQVTLARVRQVITSTRPPQAPTRARTVTVDSPRPRLDTQLLRGRPTTAPRVPLPAPPATPARPLAAHVNPTVLGLLRPVARSTAARRPPRPVIPLHRAPATKAPLALLLAPVDTRARPPLLPVEPTRRGPLLQVARSTAARRPPRPVIPSPRAPATKAPPGLLLALQVIKGLVPL